MSVLLRRTLTRALCLVLVAALLGALQACSQPQPSPQPEGRAASAPEAEGETAVETATAAGAPADPVEADTASAGIVEAAATTENPTAGSPDAESPKEGTPGAQPAPSEVASPSERPAEDTLSSECAATLAEIREREQGVPTVFYGISRPAEKIEEDVQRLTELCPKFLQDCGGTRADGFVGATLARMLMSLDKRYEVALGNEGLSADVVREKVQARRAEVLAIAERALAVSPPKSDAWFTAQRMIQEAHLRLGSYAEVRKPAEALLEKDVPYLVRTGATEVTVRSLMYERRYDEAVKFLHRVIDEYSDDPEYVVYNIRLFEALNAVGDLLGMEELMHQIRAEYPTRIKRTYPEGTLAKAQDMLRSQYEQWYWCQSLFWLGFTRMALGDMEGAELYFEENVQEVESRSAQLQSEGKSIDNVCKIITEFRSQHLIEFIRTKYGRVPEVDFDENLWATEKTLTLKEARDSKKLVAIVMRRANDPRSATFLTEIDRFVKARSGDGVVGVWLSFLTGRGGADDDQEAVEAMRSELKSLAVEMPSGYDSDRNSQNVVRELYGTVGTASFAVIDRQGRLAWWMADVRDMDRNLADRVLDRFLAEE